MKNKRGQSIVSVIAVIGVILILSGIIWLVIKNWHNLPEELKTLLLVFTTTTTMAIGILLKVIDHPYIAYSK